MSTAQSQASYILGYSDEEHKRLEQQAAGLEPGTRNALKKIGVAAGWRCLDVACGTASVTRILGGMVGPSGGVYAVDLDETYGRPAIDALNAAGPPIYHFEKFDITGDATPAGAPFDLVFARLLIVHMDDPNTVLQKMWSLVKPGGVLLVEDYDMLVASIFSDGGKAAGLGTFIRNTFAAMGKDFRAGATMPRKFLKAEIGRHDGVEVFAQFVPGKENIERSSMVVTSLTPVAIKLGVATAQEIATLLAAAAIEAKEPDSTARWPDLISTWKWKAT